MKRDAEAKRKRAARALRLRAARGIADRLAAALARRAELEARVAADAPLRAAANRLAALRDASATVAAALADRDRLERRAEAAEAAGARALAGLAPAGLAPADSSPQSPRGDERATWSPPDLSEPERAHLAAAADRHADLARDLAEAASKRRAAAERVADLKAKLAGRSAASGTGAAALSAALDRAAALPDPAAAARADRAAARLSDRIAAGLARLRGFDGTADALAAFPVPAAETLDRFAERRQKAVAAVDAAREKLAHEGAGADEARADLAALAAGGAVPSETDLAAARAARDDAWDTVRSRLLGKTPDADPPADEAPADLADRQEHLTAAADGLADSLRAEAERVKAAGMFTAAIARHEARAATARAKLETAGAALAELDAAWADEWPELSVAPLPPAEMRAWLATAAAVREDHAALLDLRERRAEEQAEATAAAAELAARLAEAEAGLDAEEPRAIATSPSSLSTGELRDRAAGVRQRLDRQAGEQGMLKSDLQKSEERRAAAAAAEADAQAGLAAWAADWATATAPLGLSTGDGGGATGPDPAAVRAFLNGWGTVQKHRADAAELRGRLGEIDAARARFATDAASLAAALAPDLPPGADPTLADPTLADPAAEVAALSERLAAAQERAKELRGLPAEIRDLQRDSDVQRAGEEAEAFLAAARAGDPDDLTARADALEAEADDLDRRRDLALAAVRDAEAALAALDTHGAAAEAEQQAQALLAKLDADADRYARLALADALLAAAAERHRARHQGPVLAQAGALFARLTGGSFAGLDVSLEEGDEPVLVGLRPSTTVDGTEAPGAKLTPPAMSDGTRDALYLSLRLAGLAETAAGRPIPPLIVDDALERFDDARTAAALAALAELAAPRRVAPGGAASGGTVQVILFTHHGRVAEFAAALPPGRATVHRLPTDHLPAVAPEPPVPPSPPAKNARRATPPAKANAAAAEAGRQKALL